MERMGMRRVWGEGEREKSGGSYREYAKNGVGVQMMRK